MITWAEYRQRLLIRKLRIERARAEGKDLSDIVEKDDLPDPFVDHGQIVTCMDYCLIMIKKLRLLDDK